LYGLKYTPLTENDPRIQLLPHVLMTNEGEYMPVTIRRDNKTVWARRNLTATPRATMVAKVDGGLKVDFGEALKLLSTEFVDSTQRPKAIRTYKGTDALDMNEMSTRFMGVSDDRLRETIKVSNGLSSTPGKVRTRRFPQGNMKQLKVPFVSKGRVQKLHRASIAEVWFTDTFEVGDVGYRYGQAYVDYRSRFGQIYPIKSRRTGVAWSFETLCADIVTPHLLIRDNIAENTGGKLMAICEHKGVGSAFICPYRKEMDYAEGYLGRMCAMATYAMVYAGAPLFFWRWAILAAVFINNITACYYSREGLWATPWELLYGEPYADSSIVMPFGCGALILLEQHQQTKFKSRCILVIFLHYATSHPLHTYAFYSPRTKKVIYRQDAIFLVNTFPMRTARVDAGHSPAGDPLLWYRTPESVRRNVRAMDSFDEVVGSDGIDAITTPRTLPEYDDHTGGGLHPPDENGLQDLSLEKTNEGSKWYPNHEAFGPPSSVEVRCPSSTMDRLPSRDSVADRKLVKGDRVSVDATVFDGEEPGSYSNFHPGRHYGVLTSFKSKTVARVKWDEHYEGGSTTDLVPVVDLKLVKVSTLSAKAVTFQMPCSTSSRNSIAPSMETSVDDDIESAGYVGEYFTDAALGECLISGFGTEGGEHILYYSPSQGGEVEWDSLSHVRQRVLDDLESTVDSTRKARRRAYYGRTRGLQGFPQNEVPTVTALMSRAASRGLTAAVPWQQRPMSSTLIRRVLRSTSSIFKYGCRIPKHDGEAERSPEAVRWKAGRDVEWLRLNGITTFDGSWTWERIKAEHPDYKKADIGTAFYIYDLKHSGEHRVRLVFNGSRQSPDTYTTTFRSHRPRRIYSSFSHARCGIQS
jgi:hypothetical protein